MNRHRGKHPQDEMLFSPKQMPALKHAVDDLSLLLTKGYAPKSSLKLVGDRFKLTKRQRLAVERSACSDDARKKRINKSIDLAQYKGEPILIDGFNLLITLEAALSGGFIFIGKDGCCRDISSVHGTYKKVDESHKALVIIGTFLNDHNNNKACWLLDSPVSNSGRLKAFIQDTAAANNWNWEVELTLNPDRELSQTESLVVSGDSLILDNCIHYLNLARYIIEQAIPKTSLINFS